jgi:hypothetical protein
MRNITAAVTQKTYEIDELELRLDVLRLSAPHLNHKSSSNGRGSRQGTPSRSVREPTPLSEAASSSASSPLRNALASRNGVNPKVASMAAKCLNDERRCGLVKSSLLAARKAWVGFRYMRPVLLT